MKNRHSKIEIKLHFVFVTKCRKPTNYLDRSEINNLKTLFAQACEKCNSKLLEINADDKNHIHLILETDGKTDIPKIANIIKSFTSKMINRRARAEFNIWPFWADGYFCASVGNSNFQTLENYIKNQGK